MITGDGAYIKKLNRGLIIHKIIEEKSVSRAELSKITGLNKATISVQVAALIDENFIRETPQEQSFVGRRPIMLSINETAGYVLGIDLDFQKAQCMVANLNGQPVEFKTITFDTTDFFETASILAETIQQFEQKYHKSQYGLIGVNIGVHGTVTKEEELQFVPAYQWRDQNLKSVLEKHVNTPITIHNNANLAAYAERVYHYHHSNHLLNIMLSSGIGGGYLVDGRLQTGCHGFSGEMGHMIIQQDGLRCSCGNDGCWEMYASEKKIYEKLQTQIDIQVGDIETLAKLIEAHNPFVLEVMEQFVKDLATGVNNLVNVYNPETFILTSDMLSVYPDAIRTLKRHLTSTVSRFGTIELSTLGAKSCALGGCAFGIQQFFDIPEIRLTLQQVLPKSTVEAYKVLEPIS